MKSAFLFAAVSVILVSGCASEPAPAASAPSVPPATSNSSGSNSSKSDDEKRSDRGNLVIEVGEPAGYSAEGTRIVDFVVTSIQVDPVCTGETAVAPENGHFVVVTMEVETAPELANETNPYFMPTLFNVVAANGTMMNGSPTSNSSFACLPEKEMINGTMGPGERATGSFVLDVPSPSGVLVLNDFNDAENWELDYPSKTSAS